MFWHADVMQARGGIVGHRVLALRAPDLPPGRGILAVSWRSRGDPDQRRRAGRDRARDRCRSARNRPGDPPLADDLSAALSRRPATAAGRDGSDDDEPLSDPASFDPFATDSAFDDGPLGPEPETAEPVRDGNDGGEAATDGPWAAGQEPPEPPLDDDLGEDGPPGEAEPELHGPRARSTRRN